MTDYPDVAIVGAGFAGLAAAAELADHGFSVELFEARDRVGGRAHTVHGEVELGPEFIHGAPDVTLDLVHGAGIKLEPVSDTHFARRDGRIAQILSVWQRFATLLEPATRPGARDESARAYLERANLSGDDAQLFATLIEGFYAADLDLISIRSIAEDAGGAAGDDGNEQSRIRGGYGSLVGVLADRLVRARVPIRLGYIVETIDYSEDPVRIDHHHERSPGSSFARRVICTLPIGVLKTGDVRFAPELRDHAARLVDFVMGQVVKVVLCLREPVWRYYAPRGLSFVHHDEGVFPTFWVQSSPQHHQLTAWAGGPHARALGAMRLYDLVDHIIDEFARCLPMPRFALTNAIIHQHFHDYARDRFAYGAYSYTRAGGAGAAQALARPIANRLYFAGEATDADYEGSVAGAIASGQRAAKQVLRDAGVVVGVPPSEPTRERAARSARDLDQPRSS